MSVDIDSSPYLDSLSSLAGRGFPLIEGAMEAVLHLVTEQLAIRSCFVTHIIPGSVRLEVQAAYNVAGGPEIKVGACELFSQDFINLVMLTGKPIPFLLEDTRSASSIFMHSGSPDVHQIGCFIGMPIVLSDGTFFGMLCALDPLPRKFSPTQAKLLVVLARLLATHFERDQQLMKRSTAENELVQMVAALQIANEQREHLSFIQNDFASIVNHEFRTTLTGIQGFSELIRDEDFSSVEIKEYADDINADAKRLSRMIGELFDLDQMKSGRMALKLERVDLNAVIMDVVDHTRPSAPQHSFHLQLDRTLPHLMGDRDKLAHVVTNLVNNAVKYSPAGGEILLSSQIEDGFVHVSVLDRGIGITPDVLERIFDPYYSRVDSGSSSYVRASRYVRGAGLGLPVARQIVQMHGGRAWAESSPASGSVFHFTISLSSTRSMEENYG